MVDEHAVKPAKLVLGPENEHYWLVKRMAKATGIDLVKAAEANIMTQEDWAGIVTHCRGCDWAEGCGRWLDQTTEVQRALPTPCINRSRLADIKSELEEMQS